MDLSSESGDLGPASIEINKNYWYFAFVVREWAVVC